MAIDEKIKERLEEIRPDLQADGGDVHFVSFDQATGLLKVELTGHCAHCPHAHITLRNGILRLVQENIDEVKDIKAV